MQLLALRHVIAGDGLAIHHGEQLLRLRDGRPDAEAGKDEGEKKQQAGSRQHGVIR